MPIFKVTAPDGRVIKVTAPEGATKEQAIAYAKANLNRLTAPPESDGFLRSAADIPLQFGIGATRTTRGLTDTFGVNNPASQALQWVEENLDDLRSAGSKRDSEAIAKVLKDAEDKGFIENAKAVAQALAIAPLDLAASTAGSIVPFLLGGKAAAAAKLGQAGTRAAMGALGAGAGVGIVKGEIYDAVEQSFKEAGASKEQAKAAAEQAASYSGGNLDQMALAGVIGGLAATVGIEKALVPALQGRVVRRVLGKEAVERAAQPGVAATAGAEFLSEGVQGAQEQVASNIALQRAGFDTPTFRGAIGSGLLEGTLGGALGAGVGALAGRDTSGAFVSPEEERRRSEAARAGMSPERRAQLEAEQQTAGVMRAKEEAAAKEQEQTDPITGQRMLDLEGARVRRPGATVAGQPLPPKQRGFDPFGRPLSAEAGQQAVPGVPTPVQTPIMQARDEQVGLVGLDRELEVLEAQRAELGRDKAAQDTKRQIDARIKQIKEVQKNTPELVLAPPGITPVAQANTLSAKQIEDQFGLSRSSTYAKDLSKLDFASPEGVSQAQNVIARALANPVVKPETKEKLQAFGQQILNAPVPTDAQPELDFGAPTPAPAGVQETVTGLTPETLRAMGISPRANILKPTQSIYEVDPNTPEGRKYVRDTLGMAVLDNKNVKPEVKARVQQYIDELTAQDAAPVAPTASPQATAEPEADIPEPTVRQPRRAPLPRMTPSRVAGPAPTQPAPTGGQDATATVPTEPAVSPEPTTQPGTDKSGVGVDRPRGGPAAAPAGGTPGTGVPDSTGSAELSGQSDRGAGDAGTQPGAVKPTPRSAVDPMTAFSALKTFPQKEAEATTQIARPVADVTPPPDTIDDVFDVDGEVRPGIPKRTIADMAINMIGEGTITREQADLVLSSPDAAHAAHWLRAIIGLNSFQRAAARYEDINDTADMMLGVSPTLEKALRTSGATEALRIIADGAQFNPIHKRVARRLLTTKEWSMPRLEVVPHKSLPDARGTFTPADNTVRLDAGDGLDATNFLHEMVHAFTVDVLRKHLSGEIESESARVVDKLFQQVKEAAGGGEIKEVGADHNAVQDVFEFASEMMANPEFQYAMMGVKVKKGVLPPPKVRGFRSVFREFVDAVMRSLGFDLNTGVESMADTALMQGLVAIDALLDVKVTAGGDTNTYPNTRNLTPSAQAALVVNTPITQTLPTDFRHAAAAPSQPKRTLTAMFLNTFNRGFGGSIMKLRQSGVDALAPVAAKMAEKYPNALRNDEGEVNPIVWMRQALDYGRMVAQALRLGGLRMDKDGLWQPVALTTKDGRPASGYAITQAIDDLAKKYGMTYGESKARVGTVLEAMRLRDLRGHNAAIEQEAATLAAAGDTQGAYEKRLEKFPLHMTNAEMDAYADIFKNTPEIQQIREMMNVVRRSFVDMMEDSGRIGKDQASAWRDVVNYVPFDRLQDVLADPEISFHPSRTGVLALSKLPQLKGSLERPVTSPVDSFMNKLAWMTKEAMFNSAATRLVDAMERAGMAKMLPASKQTSESGVALPNPVYIKGKKVYYEVYSQDDVAAFIQAPEIKSGLVKALGKSSRVLRATVTTMPMFAVNQVAMDSIRAAFNSGVQNPWRVAARTLSNFRRAIFAKEGSEFTKRIERFGITGAYDIDPTDPLSTLEYDSGARKRGVFAATVHLLERVARASDLAARLAVYERTLQEGGDVLLAQTRAREFINFNRQGTSKSMRTLVHIVPFFNSWAQGNDLIFRSMTGIDSQTGLSAKRARQYFFARMGLASVMGMMYAMAMGDDEYYQQQTDEVRDRNWLLPKGFSDMLGIDQPIKFPVPPELAFGFKSIPERMVQYFRESADGTQQETAKVLFDFAKDFMANYTMLPAPAAFKPIVENWFNYSTFTGRQLITPALQNKPPWAQYYPATSEFAKAVGKELNYPPVLIDNFIRGYFGMAGGTISMFGDAVMNPARTDRTMEKLPFLSIGLLAPVGMRSADEFYAFREDVVQAVNGKSEAAKRGTEFYRRYLQENRGLLHAAPYINNYMRRIQQFRATRMAYENHPTMSASEKRDRIVQLRKQEEQLLSRFRALRAEALERQP